jgi:hypothetical protein
VKAWTLGLALLSVLEGADLDLDCRRPGASRTLIGQAMLSEIEWAEDVSREAMWQAFGRCASESLPETCRAGERRRFEADLAREKAAIEAKYQRILEDFDARCQASIA